MVIKLSAWFMSGDQNVGQNYAMKMDSNIVHKCNSPNVANTLLII